MPREPTAIESGSRFAFVIVNRSNIVEESSLQDPKSIRSHVIREARRRKQAGNSPRPEQVSPIPFKTGRFRLHSAQTRNKSSGPTNATPISIKTDEDENQDYEPSKVAMETMSRWPRQLQPSHLVDPFHSLPITLGSRQQSLLYYYNQFFVQNDMAFNPERKFMKVAAGDPAWLNATFALLAQCFDLYTGRSPKFSADALYYRGQALRLVNERLAKSPADIDVRTIGAVATLCNFDILRGAQATATAHILGLEQLVKLRGGLDKLRSAPKMLLYIVSWCDMAFATSWGGAPRFPELKALSTPAQDDIRSCEIEKFAFLPSDHSIKLCSISHRIYTLSSLVTTSFPTPCSRRTFAQLLYITQHSLLHELSSENMDFIHTASLLASNIYIDLALREVIPQAEMHQIVVRRLMAVLTTSKSSPFEPFPSIAAAVRPNNILTNWSSSAERLLWIGFVGATACTFHNVEREFFLRILCQARDFLGLVNLEHFRVVIKLFGWVEAWAAEPSERLWGEMEWMRIRHMQKEMALQEDGALADVDESLDGTIGTIVGLGTSHVWI